MRHSKLFAPTLFLCLGLLLGACATRTTRKFVQEDENIRLLLRGKTHQGEPIDRGYAHPLTISPTRVAHLLSRIDFRPRDATRERKPAIATDLLYPLGDALSAAFAQADASQEIVGWVTEKRIKAGIFQERRLTSFIAYAKDKNLYIHFYRIDWPIPEHAADEDPFEPSLDTKPTMQFQVLAAEGMTILQSNTVAIDWQNDIFRTPSRVQVAPTGKVLRREILLQESDPPAK